LVEERQETRGAAKSRIEELHRHKLILAKAEEFGFDAR